MMKHDDVSMREQSQTRGDEMRRMSTGCSGLEPIGLGKGFVGGGSRPADDHQEHIKHEQRDSDVVVESGMGRLRPKLIGGPEEKRNREKDSFGQIAKGRAMRCLVREIGNGDESKRNRPEEV